MKVFKMILKIFAVVIALLVVAVIIFIQQPKFGRKARGERKIRVEQSPFYKDGEFTNETPTQKMTGKDSGVKTMWKFLTGQGKSERLIPQEGEIAVVKTDLSLLPDTSDFYLWFGHSSFLLQLSGRKILVDPVFVEASPVSFFNKPFPGTDYYKPDMMPDLIDYLVISHDHWDHLDYKTVTALKDHVGRVLCPLGIGEHFEYWGFAKEQIVELDCNEDFTTPDGFSFHCLPTRHFSGRGLTDAMKTQRASWIIDSPNRRIFYTGDGGYSDRFERYGKMYPDIDLAIMENGQYSENWSQIHTMPSQLGREVKELRARLFVTVHHSKYALANHAWDEPRQNEQRAAKECGVPLIVAKIGEVVYLK
jgi:L-ascorbate metabolism protein UlaG (beta-lactamase superfamily)